jgi:hypothetical protein
MIDMRLKRFGEWTFERVGGLCRLRGLHDLAFAASASTAGSGIAGVDIMGVPSAFAPADTDEQFMRLRFRSRGFFHAEPGAHLALGVAGQWRKANPATQTPGAATGRGVIIGNVSGAPNGCVHAPVVQAESFHTDGNALLAATCSPRLDDDTWYLLEFSAGNDGRIRYRLDDASGDPLADIDVFDETGDVPPGLGGWWILHAFSDHHLERDWSFEIAGLEIGWR